MKGSSFVRWSALVALKVYQTFFASLFLILPISLIVYFVDDEFHFQRWDFLIFEILFLSLLNSVLLLFAKEFHEFIFFEGEFLVIKNRKGKLWKYNLLDQNVFELKKSFFGLFEKISLKGYERDMGFYINSSFKKELVTHLESLEKSEDISRVIKIFKL